ncbi:MAG: AMP-dependent synthetase/ligase [Bacteroidales bacterium]|jgi:long-chain acyl-CoA synthetase
MEITRIFDLLPYYKEKFQPKDDVLAVKINGKWIKYDIDQFIDYVDTLSYAFIAKDLINQSKIGSISNNRPEWNFLDMACMQVGAVHVPIYPTISSEDYKYIFDDSDLEVLFISNLKLYNNIKSIIEDSPKIKEVYIFDEIEEEAITENNVKSWKELITLGKENVNREKLNEIKDNIKPYDFATLIYTSGTTGKPRGVMLSHIGFITNFKGVSPTPDFGDGSKALSFLPLCHVYERMLNYMYLYLGISIYYSENIAKFVDDCVEIQPQMMCCVPRVLEKIYYGILAKGRNLKGIKKYMFFRALKIAEGYELNNTNSKWYYFKWRIAYNLVLNKWNKALGGKFRIIVSGGSALNPKICRIFHAALIPIYEGYGITEASPVIAVSSRPPKGLKIGTVGPPLPGTEVKISDDGEILAKGPHIMLGYYKNPELTKKVIDEDGWFHTGDFGRFDEDGHLKIIGRKNENFKTSGGKWIAPQPIENKLNASKFIDMSVVFGENRKLPGALIVPDFLFLKNWCERNKIKFTTMDEILKNEAVRERYKKEINEVNKSLGKTEQIGNFILIPEEWSVKTGELGATLKVKRNLVLTKYAEQINAMYSKNDNS